MALKAGDDDVMIRYLLDDLTPQEQEESERRYFFDDVFFETLTAVECELIRDYFCDELSKTLRRKFEEKYLSSEGLRRKVDLARGLVRPSPTTPAPVILATARPSLLHRFRDFLRPGSHSFKLLPVCASLLFVMGMGWVAFEGARLRSSLHLTRAAGAPNQVVSFVLTPGQLRGASEVGAGRLLIQPAASRIRLQLDIDNKGDAKGYRAFVTRENDLVWSGDVPAARTTPQGKAVDLEMPALLFAGGGNYVIDLQALSTNGEYAPLESYSFGVLGR